MVGALADTGTLNLSLLGVISAGASDKTSPTLSRFMNPYDDSSKIDVVWSAEDEINYLYDVRYLSAPVCAKSLIYN